VKCCAAVITQTGSNCDWCVGCPKTAKSTLLLISFHCDVSNISRTGCATLQQLGCSVACTTALLISPAELINTTPVSQCDQRGVRGASKRTRHKMAPPASTSDQEKFSIVVPTVPSDDNYDRDPEVRWAPAAAWGSNSPQNCHHHCLVPLSLQVWDLIVVGAGVAGSALAYKQGKVGVQGWL
jgi:hypothetical protein